MHPTFRLAKPQNQRSTNDDAYPIAQRQRHHIEHLATETDDEDLADRYYQHSDTKATPYVLVEQALKRRIHGMIGLGVEDVPELHEDENGEEQRELLRGEITADMTEFEVTHKIIP